LRKFAAIEGLRAWLAWAVVLSHLAQVTGITWLGLGPSLLKLGHVSVLVFVIVSGFVITHLVVEKPEPYGPYIVRRFMRIYPLFIVTCLIGYYTLDVLASDLQTVAWGRQPGQESAAFIDIARADHQLFWMQLLSHLTMLHGVLGENILPNAAYAFNPPGWSLSLEWQFYLLAPLLIALLRRPSALPVVALILCAGALAYNIGLLGTFKNPSNFLGASGYFVIGIASRLLLPLAPPAVPKAGLLLASAALLALLSWDIAPIAVWAVVLTVIVMEPIFGTASAVARWLRQLLTSRLATLAGARSYSVYLCHMAVIAISLHVWLLIWPSVSRSAAFVAISVTAIPLTILISELFYRGVERPGIALGSRLARLMKTAAAAKAGPALAPVE
jgi:peptidoglycan/LPS O-acetylase OafA/YrhL